MPSPTRRVLLVAYNLPSDWHPSFRTALARKFGKEGEGWVRQQTSTILVATDMTAQEWFDWVVDTIGKGPKQRWLVVDVSEADYAGIGSPTVWDWVSKQRARVSLPSLEPTYLAVLRAIADGPKGSLFELEETLHLESGEVTTALEELDSRQWVKATSDGLTVTELGSAVIRAWSS